MTIKIYLSNIAPGWSIQRQKEMLTERVSGCSDAPTYVDLVPPAKRKAHSPASLINRTQLLRETERQGSVEAIIVASLACLAWGQTDFLQCIKAASSRGATIIAANTGRRIAPDASPADVADAAQEFVAQRRTAKGGPAGHLVSAANRSSEAKTAALSIRDRWEQPTKLYPTDPLLAAAKICRNTANQYLGKRPDAQRAYQNRMAQAARNQKRRTRVELQEQLA